MVRPNLVKALNDQVLTEAARQVVGNYRTYAELWIGAFSDRFFDMGTMIRLGSAIENHLKYYYMAKRGHQTIPELQADPAFSKNVFQRIQPWQGDSAIKLMKDQLGYDLSSNPHLPAMQEAMMHRHLYAHNLGILDAEYISRIKSLTGVDVAADPTVSASYPNSDTYYFEPIKKLPLFIEEARNFFAKLP